MKKVLVIFVVAIFATSMLTSCSKVCKCYDKEGKLTVEYPDDVSKKGCDTFNTAAQLGGGKCTME